MNPLGFGVMVPGISNVSCWKFRPLSGRPTVVLPEMTVPTVGFSVCRTGDVGADRHFVRHGADLEREIDSRRLIHFELDGTRNDLLEPRQFGGDHICADWQKRDPVHARVGRFCGVRPISSPD